MPVFLEYGITYELNRILRDLETSGTLLSLARVDYYRQSFLHRFAPDILANLQGETLLQHLHGRGTGDSLVHWLEYKNDDQFHTDLFGGISGGSAYTFGLFYSPKRGAWFAGTPTRPRQVSVEQAVEIAEAQRSELVQASDCLNALTTSGGETAYAQAQSRLDEVAAGFSDSAWGHKYLSILYPDKIDTFHSANYQRYHLIKLLIRPQDAPGRARYLAAGQFAETASQLRGGLPLLHLTQALIERHGRRPHGYWATPTRAAEGERSYWDFMLREACVPLPASSTSWANAPRENDVVAAIDGGRVLGLGYVRGVAYQTADELFPDRVPVEWRSLDYWPLPVPEPRSAHYRLHPLGAQADNRIEIERHLIADAPPFQASPQTGGVVVAEERRPFYAVPTIEGRRSDLAPDPESASEPDWEKAPELCGVPAHIEEVLRRKGQVILYGPPGTGKSHWAEIAAHELAAHSWFGRSWSRLSPTQRTALTETASAAVRTCCFHPAYGYEDFLEGYRPESQSESGDLRFELRDGIFKRLCADADARPDRDFFLIVDEINRGDVPRIFGELLAVLEKAKRGRGVLLPLSGTTFQVPPNVYLIGTMNTADRSIALLDAALRRRFGFIALGPDLSLFADVTLDGLPLGPWLGALNRRITTRLERGEGRHLQIGHAYLLDTLGAPLRDIQTFTRVLRDDIVPLLEEYTAADPSLLEALLGNGLYDRRNGLRTELLGQGRSDDLVRALVATIDNPIEEETAA